MDIRFYQIENKYIDYLSPHAPHLFHNKQAGQQNERKYIGIVLQVNGFDYFAPLSSFKPKHNKMSEMIDFIKIIPNTLIAFYKICSDVIQLDFKLSGIIKKHIAIIIFPAIIPKLFLFHP